MKRLMYLPLVASLLLSTSLSTTKAADIPMAINDLDQGTLSRTTHSSRVNLGTVGIVGNVNNSLVFTGLGNAGDMNGDGLSDVITGLLVSSGSYFNVKGSAYIIYGQQGEYYTSIELANMDRTLGFVIEGGEGSVTSKSPLVVSGAGDVNGDGLDDVIIGGSVFNGAAYVVYGYQNGYPGSIDISNFNATIGFEIYGQSGYGGSSNIVSSVGDVNGDGIDDVIVGSTVAGNTYVVYGHQNGYPGPINLGDLSYLEGFEIYGQQSLYGEFITVADGAGDVNKDGIDDIIVGAPYVGPNAGAAYVIYGKKGGYWGPINLGDFNATVGFEMLGPAASSYAGASVSGVGDVNGDNIADVVVSASQPTKSAYVVYGRQGGYPGPIALANLALEPTFGFEIQGATMATGAGDMNGDGLSDIIIQAPTSPLYVSSYVIYGCQGGYQSPINATSLTSTQGFIIPYLTFLSEGYISEVGDWNGDGRDEVSLCAVASLDAYIISDLSSAEASKKQN